MQPTAKNVDTVYVSFSAEINANTTESLIAQMSQLANQGIPNVHLLLSTPGGSVMHGITLYNTLRAMPFHLITHNAGNVDSIGNAVFLAGETRYAAPHSTFMFHGVGFDMNGQFRLEEKMMREHLNSIVGEHRRIGAILQERTALNEEQTAGLFREAQTKDAAFAVSCGIVHDIRDVKIPPGGPMLSLVFQR